MAATQEMTHDRFVDVVDEITAMGRTVGLWSTGLTLTDEPGPRGRFWRRRHIDQRRLVVYIRRVRRDPAAVARDIRRAIVRYGGRDLTADQRLTRAVALRRLTERGPRC